VNCCCCSLVIHPSIAADIVEAGQRVFTTDSKGSDPAFESLGMDVENSTDSIGILATIKEQNRVQALGASAIIGLFEASPHILALRTAQHKQFLSHRISR
jgi:hypothetical protein